MSEKTNSIFVPIDYVRELRASGQIDKADAFLTYYADMHDDEWYGFPFYAKRWHIDPQTAQQWINEFSNQISVYFSSCQVVNDSHCRAVNAKGDSQ